MPLPTVAERCRSYSEKLQHEVELLKRPIKKPDRARLSNLLNHLSIELLYAASAIEHQEQRLKDRDPDQPPPLLHH